MTTDDSSSAPRRRMGCGMLSLLAGGGTLLIVHYRVDAEEYLVYSVGVNGRDDGGVADPNCGNSADLVVRVRRKDVAAAKMSE